MFYNGKAGVLAWSMAVYGWSMIHVLSEITGGGAGTLPRRKLCGCSGGTAAALDFLELLGWIGWIRLDFVGFCWIIGWVILLDHWIMLDYYVGCVGYWVYKPGMSNSRPNLRVV